MIWAKNNCIRSTLIVAISLLLSFTRTEASATPSTSWKARSPCRSFVWDAPSAWRYFLCKKLLKGRVYEGLGGKKFVRIKPYSVLSSLYPLSRHGPDRCLICGHSFENHLATWWFPHLYSPFDRFLDEMFEKYTFDPDECLDEPTKRKPPASSRNKKKTPKIQQSNFAAHRYNDPGLQPMYAPVQEQKPFRTREFHKAYVEDITDAKNKNGGKETDPRSGGKQNKNRNHAVPPKRFEYRKIVGIEYRVPAFDVTGENMNLRRGLMLAIARTLVLDRMNSLLILQDRDNRWHKWKMLHGI